MFEHKQLRKSLVGLELDDDPKIFRELNDAYGETGRHYHDRTHISECLSQFRRFAALAEQSHEIEIAIWFHDAIYDTRKSDNEEQSAAWAERYLLGAGADKNSIERIVDMIIATKDHKVRSPDSKLMLDIDLGILGAEREVFEQHDRAIRLEYQWVPEAQYRSGRAQVLKVFLERDVIFHTTAIRQQLEERARENLSRKIRELEANRD